MSLAVEHTTRSDSTASMIRTIRMPDSRVEELLDALDKKHDTDKKGSAATSYRYRVRALVVHIPQPGFSSPVCFLVHGRAINSTGITVLHGGTVQPQTRCLVQLISSHGSWMNASGVVTKSELLEAGVHELAITFDQEIDPAMYCSEAVSSRVLLVEDDSTIARLTKFHLESLSAIVEVAVTGKSAVELALKTAYDLILMDMMLPEMDGFEATRTLRFQGYTGQIAATSGMTAEGDRERCLEAGCDDYLPKPFSRQQLASLLAKLRQEPLFSSFHDDSSMRELVQSFVQELPGRIREMEEAIHTSNIETVQSIARLLKSEGTSFGFELITEVAAGVEKATLEEKELDHIKEEAANLAKLCLQVRAPQ